MARSESSRGGIFSLSFRPNTDEVAVGSPDGRTKFDLVGEEHTSRRCADQEGSRHTEGRGETRDKVCCVPGSTNGGSSLDPTAALFDVASGRLKATLTVKPGWVHAAAFSPDGKLVTSGGDDGLQLWDAATGKHVRTLVADQEVYSTAFAPDGKMIATGLGNGDILLWDVTAGKSNTRLVGHRGMVRDLTYSPDGKLVISAGQDDTFRVWDLGTGRCIATHKHTTVVLAVAVTADGRTLASADGGGRVKFWALTLRPK